MTKDIAHRRRGPYGMDPRLVPYLPQPLSPEHEAALNATRDAAGPHVHTPEEDARMAAMERMVVAIEVDLAATHRRIQRQHRHRQPHSMPRRSRRSRPR
jgi:hypothetical protein